MLRHLLNRLAGEKAVEYLSQTYVIKRAAQMTVSAYYRLSGEKNQFLQSSQLKRIIESFKSHLKKELEDVQREIKSKRK